MKNLFYYDGPVKDSGRTLEELEKDILEDEEYSKTLVEWPPIE